MNWLIQNFPRVYFYPDYNADPKHKVDRMAVVIGVIVGAVLAVGYLALSA